MSKFARIFPRWLPPLLMMALIYIFSSQPSENLPDFGMADAIVKKGGHMFGYGLLALSYGYTFAWSPRKRWMAWILAFLFALTDEFHQKFVPGRHASIWDVLIFDNFGALLSLWLADRLTNQKAAGPKPLVLDDHG